MTPVRATRRTCTHNGWVEQNGLILYGNPKKIPGMGMPQIRIPVFGSVYLLCELIFKCVQSTGPNENDVRSFSEC